MVCHLFQNHLGIDICNNILMQYQPDQLTINIDTYYKILIQYQPDQFNVESIDPISTRSIQY